jgi:hypothetical protein
MWSFTAAVKYLIDIIPSHCMYLMLKLMLHLFIFILGLLCESWDIGRYIPPPYHKITAARYEHVVFAIIYVNHIQNYVLVLSHN